MRDVREQGSQVPGRQDKVSMGNPAAAWDKGRRGCTVGAGTIWICTVENRGGVGGSGGAPVSLQFGVGNAGTGRGEAGKVGGIAVVIHTDGADDPLRRQLGGPEYTGHLAGNGGILREDPPHVRVLQDICELCSWNIRVHRNCNAAREPHRKFHQGAVVSGDGENRYGIAGAYSARNKALGQRGGLEGKLPCGNARPSRGSPA